MEIRTDESRVRMTDAECIAFLQWLLPRLHMRWAGFRRVRKQVCKRFRRRFALLGLDGAQAYRDYLQLHPEESSVADYLCRVTISRFNRDRGVFAFLADPVLPALSARARATGATRLTAWSAGCACGEEPYTLALVWHFLLAQRFPTLKLRILATDVDGAVLERARQACYSPGTLKELPRQWVTDAFCAVGGQFRLSSAISRYVRFESHDLRSGPPDQGFDLVLCRNLAFTYFDETRQCGAAEIIRQSLRDGGALVLGRHETLPDRVSGFEVWSAPNRVYRTGSDKRLS